MAEWASQLREAYRRLQRALARQRADLQKHNAPVGAPVEKSTPAKSSGATSPDPRRLFTPDASLSGNTEHLDDDDPNEDQPPSPHGSNPGSHGPGWTAQEWEDGTLGVVIANAMEKSPMKRTLVGEV